MFLFQIHKIVVAGLDKGYLGIPQFIGTPSLPRDLQIEQTLVANLPQCPDHIAKVNSSSAKGHQMLVGNTLVVGYMQSLQPAA